MKPPTRLAITGTTGRVGRALADRLGGRHEVIELPRREWDLADPTLAERVAGLDFEILLNPAAMTSLEACEEEPERGERVNGAAPGELAAVCARLGRRMIHFSTDYVLAGERPGLHGEDEAVRPVSAYGRSKARGERGVLAAGGCVLRVSWVFGPERPAFPDQVLERALAGEPLAAIADKTSLPTFTRDLAEWVGKLIEAGTPAGIFHGCNSGEPVSWHEIAGEVGDFLVKRGRLETRPSVRRLKLAEMEAFAAERPRHTAMSTVKLERLAGGPLRGWREALEEHLDEVLISR